MKFMAACEAYFGSKDLYSILNITKYSTDKEVRKAYHKLSLCCHPDRVEDNQKAEATEKFKVLGKIHSILSDPEKKAVYDEAGLWTDEDDDIEFESKDWIVYWRSLFKKITLDDLNKYEAEYKGSKEELNDLMAVYEKCKGDMDKMYQHILFARVEDEDRIRGILQEMINNGKIPAYDIFTSEPQAKRDRRMRKMRKEAKEAEKEAMKIQEKEANSFDELQKAIMARRQENSESFLEALEKKYSCPKSNGKTPKKSSRGRGKK